MVNLFYYGKPRLFPAVGRYGILEGLAMTRVALKRVGWNNGGKGSKPG